MLLTPPMMLGRWTAFSLLGAVDALRSFVLQHKGLIFATALLAAVRSKIRPADSKAPSLRRQDAMLEELIAACPFPKPAAIGGERITVDDYRRFLRVNSWNLKKTIEVMHKDLAWRKNVQPKKLRRRDFPTASKQESWIPRGSVRKPQLSRVKGQFMPITGVSALQWRPQRYGASESQRHICFMMEEMIRRMPSNVLGAIMVIDMSGFHLGTLSYVKDGVNMMQCHYPQRLGAIILYNLPSCFPYVWKVISPMFNEDIRSKIMFPPRRVSTETEALAWADR